MDFFFRFPGTAIGVVIYTGPECRATMNNSKPRSKVGLVDIELNDLTKILILATVVLSILMVCLKGFHIKFRTPYLTCDHYTGTYRK